MLMKFMKKYKCYTDGSYQASRNTGGWASIICDENDNVLKELYQGHKFTTNNREEIRAVLETLKYFKEPSDITIVSDSNYVVNTINQGWVKKWFDEKDFSKSNLDLWFNLLDLLEFHKVTVKWTKGHSNNNLNNRADELAQFSARCLNLPEDEYCIKNKKVGESLVSEHRTWGSNRFSIGQKDGKILFSLGQE